MKISNELAKKFLNVSISLSEKDKENIFFRQRDPNVLISLAKYAQKNGVKSISFDNLKKLYNRDVILRKVLFSLIRSIEDKLTGAIVQRISYGFPDFHLKSSNFELVKSNGMNIHKHFLTVNKFMLDLKYQHNNAIRRMKHIPHGGYIRLEEIISEVSLGIKAKLVKYSKPHHKIEILKAFNMTKDNNWISVAADFLMSLNYLRNRVMHHDSVIDWIWKINKKTHDIFEFIKIATYFGSWKEISDEINNIPELSNFNKITKKEMISLIF